MYDPVLGDRLLRKQERRPRSNFDFVQEGRFQKQAEMQRLRVSPLVLCKYVSIITSRTLTSFDLNLCILVCT